MYQSQGMQIRGVTPIWYGRLHSPLESMEFWRGLEPWTVPIGLFASQILKVGGQPISLPFGPRVSVDGPSGGPEWGLRFNAVLLFPK